MPLPRPLGLLLVIASFAALAAPAAASAPTRQATPTALSCEPLNPPSAPPSTPAPDTAPAATPVPFEGEPVEVTVGYIPVSIYAPVFVAEAKGYFAEQGLDVSLENVAGGSEVVALTASGQFDLAATGAGPGFWNAMAQGLPLAVVAPGHAEGSPVATPLMISKEACESGAIASVADLEGKSVSVNARGATEYWLAQALGTAGLTLDDVDLQVLAFPDAVAALSSGAIDAAMVGEPLATQAERDGIAVRLAADFPVQDVQPTVILANTDFAGANPAAVEGFVTAYLRAARDLTGPGFKDPANLAIVEEFTGVPAALIADAVQPLYFPNGEIDAEGFNKLQTFFRERGQLEYDEDIDPATFVETRYVEAALAALGPYQGG
jgi:NitT/TauT family transport system substrate-binding protein